MIDNSTERDPLTRAFPGLEPDTQPLPGELFRDLPPTLGDRLRRLRAVRQDSIQQLWVIVQNQLES